MGRCATLRPKSCGRFSERVMEKNDMDDLAKRRSGSALTSAEHQQRVDAARSKKGDGSWSWGTKLGLAAGAAAAWPVVEYAGRRLVLRNALAHVSNELGHDGGRGTSQMGARTVWRHRSEIPEHIRDMMSDPTAVGKARPRSRCAASSRAIPCMAASA
jgi:hypothetical protein